MPLVLEGVGNVQAFNSVVIRPQVDGQVVRIAFAEGQEVKPDDLLVQIDPRVYQAAVDQMAAKKAQDEAQLGNARRDLQRYEELARKSFATQQQLDTTRALADQLSAAVRGDQASLESARVQLEHTSIRSPINGRVGIKQVDVGNIVHASESTALVVLTQMQPISVVFTLPEDTLPSILKAMKAGALLLSVWSRGGQRKLEEGALALVDNQIDQSTGTIRLKATLPNLSGMLWPGQFVNVRLQVGMHRQAVTVPAAAVQRGAEGTFAFVVGPDSVVEARKLDVGTGDENDIVVEKGIRSGEVVVTEGQFLLRNGVRVATGKAGGPSGSVQ